MTEKRKQCEMLPTVGADSQGHKGELASSRKAHSTSTVRKKKWRGRNQVPAEVIVFYVW